MLYAPIWAQNMAEEGNVRILEVFSPLTTFEQFLWSHIDVLFSHVKDEKSYRKCHKPLLNEN